MHTEGEFHTVISYKTRYIDSPVKTCGTEHAWRVRQFSQGFFFNTDDIILRLHYYKANINSNTWSFKNPFCPILAATLNNNGWEPWTSFHNRRNLLYPNLLDSVSLIKAKFRWEITFSALHPFLAPIRRPSLIFAILDFLTQSILAELDSLTAKTLKKTPCSQIPLSEGTSRLKNPFCLNFGGRLRKLWMGTLETFQNWWSLVENIQFDTDCTWMNILQSKVHWEYVHVCIS